MSIEQNAHNEEAIRLATELLNMAAAGRIPARHQHEVGPRKFSLNAEGGLECDAIVQPPVPLKNIVFNAIITREGVEAALLGKPEWKAGAGLTKFTELPMSASIAPKLEAMGFTDIDMWCEPGDDERIKAALTFPEWEELKNVIGRYREHDTQTRLTAADETAHGLLVATRNLPNGHYILRKKFDGDDSFDIAIPKDRYERICDVEECGYTLTLREAFEVAAKIKTGGNDKPEDGEYHCTCAQHGCNQGPLCEGLCGCKGCKNAALDHKHDEHS